MFARGLLFCQTILLTHLQNIQNSPAEKILLQHNNYSFITLINSLTFYTPHKTSFQKYATALHQPSQPRAGGLYQLALCSGEFLISTRMARKHILTAYTKRRDCKRK